MQKGNILIVNLDPTVGSEISKTRPCVLVTPNDLIDLLKVVQVVPLTGTDWEGAQFRVPIQTTPKGGKSITSYAAVDQIKTVSKDRIVKVVDPITKDELANLTEVIVEYFS